MLPAGRRRTALTAAVEAMFAEDLVDRVLPYDSAAATRYAEIVVARRRVGSPIEAFDALIAATALSIGAGVATRDIGGFDGCGLRQMPVNTSMISVTKQAGYLIYPSIYTSLRAGLGRTTADAFAPPLLRLVGDRAGFQPARPVSHRRPAVSSQSRMILKRASLMQAACHATRKGLS
jgi:hypothetical protein